MKHCKRCDQTKPLEEFHVERKSKDGHCFYCKECNKIKTRQHYRENVDKVAERARTRRRTHAGEFRNYQYQKKYGISLSEYEELLDVQEGKCAICEISKEETNDSRALPVDHDHETGRIRGILCHACNRAIGLFKDNPSRLRKAAEYLEMSDLRVMDGAGASDLV